MIDLKNRKSHDATFVMNILSHNVSYGDGQLKKAIDTPAETRKLHDSKKSSAGGSKKEPEPVERKSVCDFDSYRDFHLKVRSDLKVVQRKL